MSDPLTRKELKAIDDEIVDIGILLADVWHAPQPDSLTSFGVRLVRLHGAKARLKKAVSMMHKAYESAKSDLIESFLESDSTGIKVAGKNLFPVQKIGCKRKVDSTPAIAAALRSVGLGDLVYEQTNARSLASHFGEQIPDDFVGDPNEYLPEELREVLELTEYKDVGVRST